MLSGFLTGLILGIVWSPCGGPILASIAVLAATGQVHFTVVLVTLAYVIGVGIPLFGFIYGGQQLVARTRFLSKYTGRIQQIFGVIMILMAVAIYFNVDKLLQAKLLETFPAIGNSFDAFENNSAVTNQLNALKGSTPIATPTDNSSLLPYNVPAPEFSGITNWLNTDHPLTMKELKGKVVLVDFWTYTCINCIRTLPHTESLYEKYKDQGFVVVGVHTPEFAFEKDTTNVANALKQFGITYPVAQDNNYGTWNAYGNEYWPAEYLIDANGNVRHTHFGEGEYDQTEKAVQVLLAEAGKSVPTSIETIPDLTPVQQSSPESYIGSDRAEYYFPDHVTKNGTRDYTLSNAIPVNSFSLGGTWTIENADAIAGKDATLSYHFNASNVFLVLRPGTNASAKLKIFLDGKPVDATNAGTDVANGEVTVDKDRLYNLIDLKGKYEDHVLRIEFENPGTQAFAFTFG